MILEEIDMRTRLREVCAVATTVALSACGTAGADPAPERADAPTFARVINVEVREIQVETFVEEIRLTSVAMANQDVMLEAEEDGVIRELFVDRGDWVSAGDPIAQIDDRILRTQVEQARAAAELGEQTWQRRKRLWEEDQIGSEIAYLETKFGAEQSAAVLRGLEERLARTVVRAPFSGVLDERHVDVGATVGQGATIGRLVDLDPIKVFAGVPERYSTDVKVGAGAQMTFEALGDEVYTAPIRYVGATINPQNRTFSIEVVISNPDGRIKPQMVANMAVTRQEVLDAIVVPQDALVRVEDGYVLFVAREEGGQMVAEVRPVQLGPTRRNVVVIEQGATAGERLIVVGQKSVADGDFLNVVGH
jgi:membrane fusion protein (multidrug efflux system)